jgi:hypothetical protein
MGIGPSYTLTANASSIRAVEELIRALQARYDLAW